MLSFLDIGTDIAWTACQAYIDFTETLLALSDETSLQTIDSVHMAHLECWTVVMYSKSSGCSRVNDARRQLSTLNWPHSDVRLHPTTHEVLLLRARRTLTRPVISGDIQCFDIDMCATREEEGLRTIRVSGR